MKQSRIIVLFTSMALVLAGWSGAAVADDGPSASPSPLPGNQAPLTVDDSAPVTAGTSVTIDVVSNDTDDGLGRPEGTTAYLEVVAVSGGLGRLTFDTTSITYLPGRKEHGEVHLTYQVSDGQLQATGRVLIRVRSVETKQTVTIHVAKRLVGLRTYRIRGVVSPGNVRVRLEMRKTARRWTRFATVRVDTAGHYALGYTPNRIGPVSFRAVAARTAGKPTTSDTITRRVIARPDVHVSRALSRSQVRYSWRPGCPVSPASLREITINRFDYGRTLRRGSLIVDASAVPDIVTVMRAAFDKRFPIRRMRPADHYYDHGRRTPSGSDIAAMGDDNTSAFNCRPVTGNPYRISQHSYGNAIDINTVRNPYVTGSRVYPSWAGRYLNRSRYRSGMILTGGVVASRMRAVGWSWGARWGSPDYQHFSANGG